ACRRGTASDRGRAGLAPAPAPPAPAAPASFADRRGRCGCLHVPGGDGSGGGAGRARCRRPAPVGVSTFQVETAAGAVQDEQGAAVQLLAGEQFAGHLPPLVHRRQPLGSLLARLVDLRQREVRLILLRLQGDGQVEVLHGPGVVLLPQAGNRAVVVQRVVGLLIGLFFQQTEGGGEVGLCFGI